MEETKELVLEATVENLSVVNAFIDELLASVEYSLKKRFQLDLVVEEIFVNIANYAYGEGTGQAVLRFSLQQDPPKMKIVFMDEGVAYDPLAKDEPDVTLPIEERNIGGLGIFLVKKNVEDIQYERKDGKNILTIYKDLG
ncbi:MAG: ATP-binding protein [Selenomonadaceae bacterium]|nr:ATP-binding protein [Selenomonadaceae bacterium]